MEHIIKEIKENIDVLKLTRLEFDALNEQYKNALRERINTRTRIGVSSSLIADINDMKTIIMTDGYNRVEFKIEIT